MQNIVNDTFLYVLTPFLSNTDVMQMVVVNHHYHTILRDQTHSFLLQYHKQMVSHYRDFVGHMMMSTRAIDDVLHYLFKRIPRSIPKKRRLALPLKSIH